MFRECRSNMPLKGLLVKRAFKAHMTPPGLAGGYLFIQIGEPLKVLIGQSQRLCKPLN